MRIVNGFTFDRSMRDFGLYLIGSGEKLCENMSEGGDFLNDKNRDALSGSFLFLAVISFGLC